MENLIFLVIIVAVFYFLLIRPQQRRVKQHQQLIGSIDIGDEVVTAGGVYGRVEKVDDESFYLKVDDSTTMRFAKGAVNRKVEPEAPTTE